MATTTTLRKREMAVGMQALPLELLEDVVDRVLEAGTSLSALAETGRFLVPICQQRLFASVFVPITILSKSLSGPTRAENLVSLLKRSPRIASFTSHLTVSFTRVETSKVEDALQLFSSLLAYFINVKRISVKSYLDSPHVQSLLPVDRVLRLTQLCHIDFDGIPLCMLRNLHLMPNLKHLGLSDTLHTTPPLKQEPSSSSCSQNLQLNSLLINFPSPPFTLSGIFEDPFLKSLVDLSHLRKLGICIPFFDNQETHAQVWALLQRSSTFLEVFSFTPSTRRLRLPENQGQEIIQLGTLTSLRVLHLDLCDGFARRSHAMEWVIDILKKPRILPRLTTLVISMDYREGVIDKHFIQARHEQMNRFTDVLTGQRRFPSLGKVVFHLNWPSERMPPEEIFAGFRRSCLVARLEHMEELGLLKLSSGSHYRDILFPSKSKW